MALANNPRNGHYEDGRFVMYNYRAFLDVFDFDLGSVYARKQVEEIEGCRRRFEGLFVDRVLKLVGVKRREFIFFF